MNGYDNLSIDALFRLDNEVALVTGGGDGFGRIASMAYANAGASVAVTDIDKEKADAVVAEITAGGGHAVALQLDLARRDDAAYGEGLERCREGPSRSSQDRRDRLQTWAAASRSQSPAREEAE